MNKSVAVDIKNFDKLIIKNNKAIGIFMGGKTSNTSRVVSGFQNIWLPLHGICRYDTIDLGKGKTLKYHISWDWLIPVIDKIKSDDTYHKYIDYTINMYDNPGVTINTKYINVTYDNVVDFINWYNENIKQN